MKNIKLQVGEWYKIELYGDDETPIYHHYMKFKAVDELIAQIDDNGYFDFIEGFINDSDSVSNSIELKYIALVKHITDLSEIQFFLPEGHTDKIAEKTIAVLPEKWYTHVTLENRELLNDFMHANSNAWRDYTTKWKVTNNDYYFVFPPLEPDHGHSISGFYKELTDNKKYVQIPSHKINELLINQKPKQIMSFKNEIKELMSLANDEKLAQIKKEIRDAATKGSTSLTVYSNKYNQPIVNWLRSQEFEVIEDCDQREQLTWITIRW